MNRNSQVIVEARRWEGTPYRHQHSTFGAGCDCLGLVRGVYRNVVGVEPERPPNYSPSWGEGDRREVLLAAAGRHLLEVDHATPGDVLIFRMMRGSVAKHCGILVSPNSMVHAYQGASKVVESPMVPYWWNRVVGIYRFPEVQ